MRLSGTHLPAEECRQLQTGLFARGMAADALLQEPLPASFVLTRAEAEGKAGHPEADRNLAALRQPVGRAGQQGSVRQPERLRVPADSVAFRQIIAPQTTRGWRRGAAALSAGMISVMWL